MADVDTPTCRAISARVIPWSSTNLRETSALTAGISPRRLPLRNSVRETLRFLHSSAIKRSTFQPRSLPEYCRCIRRISASLIIRSTKSLLPSIRSSASSCFPRQPRTGEVQVWLGRLPHRHRRRADTPHQPTVAGASRQFTNGRQHPSDQSPRRWLESILATRFQHPQHSANMIGFKCRKASTLSRGASKSRHCFQRSRSEQSKFSCIQSLLTISAQTEYWPIFCDCLPREETTR